MTLPTAFKGFQSSDGIIRRLPVKLSKKVALAEWAITLFEPDRVYSEPEVNDLIGQYILDFALIRRMLVEAGKLERDKYGKEYRKVLALSDNPNSLENY
jgi:hypothetical protein